MLRYNKEHVQGHWRGIWWGGRQHGLQLWCRTDEAGREVEATPFLFKHDIKVEGTVPPELATAALAQWEARYKHQAPSQSPLHTAPSTTTATTTTTSNNEKEMPFSDRARVRALLAADPPSDALLVVRVTLPSGATVRDGVEIDVAEQVRNLAQDTVVQIAQRVVTPEGIPRLQLYDGTWISERLRGARGGPEEAVVEVLRHNPPR